MQRSKLLQLILAFLILPISGTAQPRPRLPEPDFANVRYGPDVRNVLDIWQCEGPDPKPLVIYYHGGGFRGGDKRTLSPRLLKQLLVRGISVAAVNYRLSGSAPYPAQMHDCARALQFIRLHATDYRIDSERIGATGGSAGAGISQWLAFKDDLGDPNSHDPLLQQSTRLAAIVPYNAQSSYDPRFIQKLMNTNQVDAALIQFYGMESAQDVTDPRFQPLFEDASPLNHLSPDDPPILVYYNQRNDPLPTDSPGKLHIHHPKFGLALKKKAENLGVECTILFREDHPEGYPIEKFVAFFAKKLGKERLLTETEKVHQ